MLILTEKPSVAKDFAKALCCYRNNGYYINEEENIIIINCIGHLFSLYAPKEYDEKYSDWKLIPIIPNSYKYKYNNSVEIQAKFVIKTLKEHREDKIIIATDADREGEIIARECLLKANITDFSKIKRFWVSQALTDTVIKDGLKDAKSLSEYNLLSNQGFSRQHADWLVGMNFTRYITSGANKLLPVGRVQTAILSAINNRCKEISNFVSKNYFECYGYFSQSLVPEQLKGIYFNKDNQTKFSSNNFQSIFDKLKGKKALLINKHIEQKNSQPPKLYNLNALQKEAFRCYGYTAENTLNIVQSLYEELKCVSYPRTPSRVMGEKNIDLCRSVYEKLIQAYPIYSNTKKMVNITISNKQCFNDSKLEAHHALIPLDVIDIKKATEEQLNIYYLILERFMMAFLPEQKFNKIEYILEVGECTFKIIGKDELNPGWKDKKLKWKFLKNEVDEEQDISKFDFHNLYLTQTEIKEKWTLPPKHFNEASILSFMENPTNVNEDKKKLVGLGTPATRHTFIPKLLKSGYIIIQNKNILCTKLGEYLLDIISHSSIKDIANVEQTTIWEERLNCNPNDFYKEIVNYVDASVKQQIVIQKEMLQEDSLLCPICHKEIRKGKLNWYCSGYKTGCTFPSIWISIAGATVTKSDIKKLLEGKPTNIKHCVSKNGKKFDCKFMLDDNYKLIFKH